MRRRELITLFGGAAAAWPLAAKAQQAGKIHRIGFLANDPTIPQQPAGQAFLDGLRESGFTEGKNISIERRFAEAKADRYDALVAQLLALKIDVLVTSLDAATLAAKRATTKIPIVMMNVADPVGQGIITSLAHPGGNITGLVRDELAVIAEKRLQLLKDAVPRIADVAVLLDSAFRYDQAQWEQLEVAARRLNLTLRRLEASRASEIAEVFASIGQNRPDALFVSNNGLMFVNRSLITELAAKARLPTMSLVKEYTEAGGLMSYGHVRTDAYRRAAIYVGKILKGAKPADLPVEQPTKYELVINVRAAQALNLEIPRDLLVIADDVIE